MTTYVSEDWIYYIAHNVKDYSVLHNNAVCPVICEGWCLHDHTISLGQAVSTNNTSFTPPLSFYWSAFAKPGKWAFIYLCVRGIHFTSFYVFDMWFWNCSDSVVCFFLFIYIFWYQARFQYKLCLCGNYLPCRSTAFWGSWSILLSA